VVYSTLQRCPKPPQGQQGQGEGGGTGLGQEGDGSGDGDGEGNGNGFTDPTAIRKPQAQNGTTPDAETLENEWKIASIQAAIQAKSRGNLPGSLAGMVKESAKPKVNWRAELRRFMQQAAKDDYSWRRPNARYMARGLYMPSLHSEQMGPVVIAIDTSGSIGEEELQGFMGETESAIEEGKPEYALVIQADAAISHVERYERHEPFVTPKVHGRGGTDFRPVFDYIEREDVQPACLIYLTDLYGPYPEFAPGYPVLWVCTNDQQANWGETIRLDIHN
jgi:predicted metal-dependent peptidase